MRFLISCFLCFALGYGIGRYHEARSYSDVAGQLRQVIETKKRLDEGLEHMDRIIKKFKGLEQLPSGYNLHIEKESYHPFRGNNGVTGFYS